MIVQLVGKHLQDDYIVCPRVPVTVDELRERMLQRAAVAEGSYAYRLINVLHSAVFLESLDLKKDYQTYFACEYDCFGEYLRRRVRIPSTAIATLLEAFDVSSGMYHFSPTQTFFTDSYGLEFLRRLLDDPAARETP